MSKMPPERGEAFLQLGEENAVGGHVRAPATNRPRQRAWNIRKNGA
jgi:hypothetical protein